MKWRELFKKKSDDRSQADLFLQVLGDKRALEGLDPNKPEELLKRKDIVKSQILGTWIGVHAAECFEAAVMTHRDGNDKIDERRINLSIALPSNDPAETWKGDQAKETLDEGLRKVFLPATGIIDPRSPFKEDKELALTPAGAYARKHIFLPIFKVLRARIEHDSSAITQSIQDADKIVKNAGPMLNAAFDSMGYTASEKALHIPRIVREAKAALLIVKSPVKLEREDALKQLDRQRE